MGSLRFKGVLFVAYPNDHPPRHVHGFTGETEVIVDLLLNGDVALAERRDAIRPLNAKRPDVKKFLPQPQQILNSSLHFGRPFMAKHKVITTDTEIDAATECASQLKDEPRVLNVEYRPGRGLDIFILQMSDGHRCVLPREDLQGLQGATRQQIAEVEILGQGTGLHWPALNVDLYVPALLQGIYGTRQWMSQIGRAGGAKTSARKRRTSRVNGLKGGRPRQTGLTVAA